MVQPLEELGIRRLSANSTGAIATALLVDNGTTISVGKMVLGITFVVLGTISSAVGANLMKWSHETEEELPLLRRWRLWLGLFCALILLFVCDAVSYGVLPLALIAPFGGFPIIISAVLAGTGACGVREPIEGVDIGAMLAVFVGVTVVSFVTASTGYAAPNLDALATDSFGNPTFVTLMLIAAAADTAWLSLHFHKGLRARTVDAWEGNAAVWPTVVSSALAAVNTCFQQVFMKTISEAVHELGDGVPSSTVLGNMVLWGALIGVLTLGPLSAILINLSLGPGRSINLAVPVYQSLTLFFTIASGAFFLHELQVSAEPRNSIPFVLAVIVVLLGLLALSYRQQARMAQKQKGESQPLKEGLKPAVSSK
jgi:hypothetical protein